MKRLLKYELSRIIYSKRYFILAACLICLFLLGIYIIFNSLTFSTINVPDATQKAEILQKYQSQIEYLESMIEESGLDYNHPYVSNALSRIEKYKFFISTGTVESEYIPASGYMSKIENYESAGFCFFLWEYSIFPFIIAAIFAALWAFSFEKSGGTLKNLLQGSDRRTAFDGKLLVSAALAIGVPLLVLIFDLILMSVSNKLPLLINDNGYRVMSNMELLAQIGLRNLLMIAFVYAATLFCTTFFKPLVSGLIVPLGIVFIGFIAMIIANESNMMFLNKYSFKAFNAFPVVGLINYAGGFDLTFGIMSVIHLAFVAVLVFFSRLRFRKMNL